MAYVERFSNRVEDYALARPSYPAAMLDLLSSHGLGPAASVVDVGSGTGILTQLLLDRGAEVYAVEPNQAMREEAERQLGSRPGFHSIAAGAESTTLADGFADLITAAQAFHWFDVTPTRQEWVRILKPGGWVALMWNERIDESEFSRGYGQMARAFVEEQGPATSRLIDPVRVIEEFFAGRENFTHHKFPNDHHHDLSGLKARALSSSYWPRDGEAYEKSMARLEEIFELHRFEGRVRFEYVTEVFLGQLR